MEFRVISVPKKFITFAVFQVFIDDIRNAPFQFQKYLVQFSLILTESHQKLQKFIKF